MGPNVCGPHSLKKKSMKIKTKKFLKHELAVGETEKHVLQSSFLLDQWTSKLQCERHWVTLHFSLPKHQKKLKPIANFRVYSNGWSQVPIRHRRRGRVSGSGRANLTSKRPLCSWASCCYSLLFFHWLCPPHWPWVPLPQAQIFSTH